MSLSSSFEWIEENPGTAALTAASAAAAEVLASRNSRSEASTNLGT
jgi:hypothetical protein